MRLSFVIPAYNEEAYVGRCLEAVLNNLAEGNYDAEIIVVNNASIDRTKEVALSYPNVQVVDEPKKGLVQARHSGYCVATGDLIANIDADTQMPSGWVKRVMETFDSNPDLVGLSGPATFPDMPIYFNLSSYPFYALGMVFNKVIKVFTKEGAIFQGGNFVVKKSALDQIGGFNVGKYDFYGEDTEIACRVSRVGPTKFDFKLKNCASSRRFKGEGIFTLTSRYIINFFWPMIFKKPFSKTSIDIREKTN